MREAARARLGTAGTRLAALEAHLKHLNPELVLERGYAIALDASGAVVRDAAKLAPGDDLTVKLARGSAATRVVKTPS
jgi:exodeoxyribonuclease VII large subunit